MHSRTGRSTAELARALDQARERLEHLERMVAQCGSELLTGAMDCLDAPVFILSPDTRIVYCNAPAALMADLERTEVIGATAAEILPEDQAELLTRHLHEVMELGEPLLCAGCLELARFGRRTMCAAQHRYVTTAGESYVVTTIYDATDQAEAEENLRKNASDVRQMFDAAPTAVLVVGLADGIILYANSRAEHIFAMPKEELIGHRTLEGLWEDMEAYSEARSMFLEGRDVEELEVVSTNLSGQRIWLLGSSSNVNFEGEPAALLNFVDITERKLAEKAVRQAEQTYRTIFENAAEGIFQSAPEGRLLNANQAMASILGYGSPDELLAQVTDLAVHLYVNAADRARLFSLVAEHGSVANFECPLKRKDGSTFWAALSVSAVRDEMGRVEHIEGLLRDESARKRAEQELTIRATRDQLTGLANRAHFLRRLAEFLEAGGDAGGRMAVLFIDLDFFKQINDTYGHHVGDEVLREVARRLRRALYGSGEPARLGGDEFAALLYQSGENGHVESVARRIIEDLNCPIEVDGLHCRIGCSVGASVFPDNGMDAEDLLQKADEAMYTVKESGKNDFRPFQTGA
ncbi:MAG: diguanylate cyclase [Desulfovibrionaceae bacterium]|nr:diguanylate cyclase [Desulfovibrionaceae bacterium]